MLNILFAFFLFGMLCVLCGKGIYRVYKYQQGFSPQEYALLVALSIGTLAAIYMGVNKRIIKLFEGLPKFLRGKLEGLLIFSTEFLRVIREGLV